MESVEVSFSWNTHDAPPEIRNGEGYTDVAYGNGWFVALPTTSTTFSTPVSVQTVSVSTDASYWSTSTIPTTLSSWVKMTYGNNQFVAVASHGEGHILYSMATPLIDVQDFKWGVYYTGDDGKAIDIAYGDGIYVIIGNSGVRSFALSSYNLTLFPVYNPREVTSHTGVVTHGNGQFVVLLDDDFVFSSDSTRGPSSGSTDGSLVWTTHKITREHEHEDSVGYWVALEYGNGMYISIFHSTSTSSSSLMTSETGLEWKFINQWTSQNDLPRWRDIAFGLGLFVIVASSGNLRTAISVDGVHWNSTVTMSGNTKKSSWTSVAYGDGIFVATASLPGETDTNTGDSSPPSTISNQIPLIMSLVPDIPSVVKEQTQASTSLRGIWDLSIPIVDNTSICQVGIMRQIVRLPAYIRRPVVPICIRNVTGARTSTHHTREESIFTFDPQQPLTIAWPSLAPLHGSAYPLNADTLLPSCDNLTDDASADGVRRRSLLSSGGNLPCADRFPCSETSNSDNSVGAQRKREMCVHKANCLTTQSVKESSKAVGDLSQAVLTQKDILDDLNRGLTSVTTAANKMQDSLRKIRESVAENYRQLRTEFQSIEEKLTSSARAFHSMVVDFDSNLLQLDYLLALEEYSVDRNYMELRQKELLDLEFRGRALRLKRLRGAHTLRNLDSSCNTHITIPDPTIRHYDPVLQLNTLGSVERIYDGNGGSSVGGAFVGYRPVGSICSTQNYARWSDLVYEQAQLDADRTIEEVFSNVRLEEYIISNMVVDCFRIEYDRHPLLHLYSDLYNPAIDRAFSIADLKVSTVDVDNHLTSRKIVSQLQRARQAAETGSDDGVLSDVDYASIEYNLRIHWNRQPRVHFATEVDTIMWGRSRTDVLRRLAKIGHDEVRRWSDCTRPGHFSARNLSTDYCSSVDIDGSGASSEMDIARAFLRLLDRGSPCPLFEYHNATGTSDTSRGRWIYDHTSTAIPSKCNYREDTILLHFLLTITSDFMHGTLGEVVASPSATVTGNVITFPSRYTLQDSTVDGFTFINDVPPGASSSRNSNSTHLHLPKLLTYASWSKNSTTVDNTSASTFMWPRWDHLSELVRDEAVADSDGVDRSVDDGRNDVSTCCRGSNMYDAQYESVKRLRDLATQKKIFPESLTGDAREWYMNDWPIPYACLGPVVDVIEAWTEEGYMYDYENAHQVHYVHGVPLQTNTYGGNITLTSEQNPEETLNQPTTIVSFSQAIHDFLLGTYTLGWVPVPIPSAYRPSNSEWAVVRKTAQMNGTPIEGTSLQLINLRRWVNASNSSDQNDGDSSSNSTSTRTPVARFASGGYISRCGSYDITCAVFRRKDYSTGESTLKVRPFDHRHPYWTRDNELLYRRFFEDMVQHPDTVEEYHVNQHFIDLTKASMQTMDDVVNSMSDLDAFYEDVEETIKLHENKYSTLTKSAQDALTLAKRYNDEGVHIIETISKGEPLENTADDACTWPTFENPFNGDAINDVANIPTFFKNVLAYADKLVTFFTCQIIRIITSTILWTLTLLLLWSILHFILTEFKMVQFRVLKLLLAYVLIHYRLFIFAVFLMIIFEVGPFK